MTAELVGKVLSVDTRPLGENLVSDALTGTSVFYVTDAGPFVGTMGVVVVEGVAYQVSYVDVETDTVTLASPLTADVPADSLVEVFPTTPEKYATVDLGAEAGEGVEALVPHALVELLPDGIRDPDDQETVTLDPDGIELTVTDVRGKSLATNVISLDRFTPEVIALITMRFPTEAARDVAIPEPVEGMQAYVADVNLDYQYTSGQWVPKLKFVRKGVTQANSSTNLVNDSQLSVQLVPGWYRIEALLHLRGNPDGDVVIAWTYSGNVATGNSRVCLGPSSEATTGSSTLMRTTGNLFSSSIRYGVTDTASDVVVREDLLFQTTTLGVLQLRFAKAETASGNVTMTEESRLFVTKVQ